MDVKIQIDECIELCLILQRQIENDGQIPPDCLGGAMLPAYEELRRSQLATVKEVYKRLRTLERRV